MKPIDLWLKLFPDYEKEKGEYYPITFTEFEYALEQYKNSIPVGLPVKPEIAEKSLQKYLDNAKRLCEIANESHKITQEMLDQKF